MVVSLDYYRVFHCVAEAKSISLAAQRLYLSQPAVTRTIRKLEREIGCPLFVRTPRGVTLTAEGEKLAAHVLNAMNQLDTGEMLVRKLAVYGSGSLSIGTTENALAPFLLPRLKSFCAEYPGAHIHVTGGSTDDLLAMIRSGGIELALVMEPIGDTSGLDITPLRRYQDIFVAGEAFAQLRGEVLSAQDLTRFPLVGLERGTSSRRHISAWFEAQGALFEPQYSVRTSMTVLPFARHGLGIGTASLDVLDATDAGGLFEIALSSPVPPRSLCLARSDSARRSALCQKFIERLL